MLSYRHGFHAGNAADVLKHSTLIFCLEYLTQKEKPLLCVDTHAGAGRYSLTEGFAAQKREWEQGLGKLLNRFRDREAPSMTRRYLQICSPDAAEFCPGSPLIMARLLRAGDRLVCFELHPADYRACAENLRGRAETRQADGFAGLKGLLPPPSRRGLILIDPPYEVKDDYNRVPETVARALRRFPAGVYLVWYPLLRETPGAAENAGDLPGRLMDLYKGNRCRIELYTGDPGTPIPRSPRGMYGSGLIIFNPPWTLKAALEENLPVLGALLGTGREPLLTWNAQEHAEKSGGTGL